MVILGINEKYYLRTGKFIGRMYPNFWGSVIVQAGKIAYNAGRSLGLVRVEVFCLVRRYVLYSIVLMSFKES